MRGSCTEPEFRRRVVSPTAVAVAGLSAIAIAASGCSGDSGAETDSPIDITELRAEFKQRYGEAPWYKKVAAIEWADGRIEVTTDLDEATEASAPPCGDLRDLAFELADDPTAIGGVVVVGSGGAELRGCG
jgi:hypothetical protein